MLVSLSVSETKDFNLQSKMEISDDSEAITDSEEEYSRSIGKIVTVNKNERRKEKRDILLNRPLSISPC